MSINSADNDELAMERRGSVPLEPDSVAKCAYYIVKLLVRESPESSTDVMGGKRCLMHVEIDANGARIARITARTANSGRALRGSPTQALTCLLYRRIASLEVSGTRKCYLAGFLLQQKWVVQSKVQSMILICFSRDA